MPNFHLYRIATGIRATVFGVALALPASVAFAQSCPTNFFDILEGAADTTAVKQEVGQACRGRNVTLRGTVVDVAKRGETYELHLASANAGKNVTVLMRDSPGTDLSQLKKGAPVVVAANLRAFTGEPTEYLTLDDGNCTNCGF